jgi:TPR repeat protein
MINRKCARIGPHLPIPHYNARSGEKIIDENIPEAIKWLRLAADNGDLRAHDLLWRAYLHKGNVDEEKALTYLLIAAKNGVTNAQRFLGICYMNGSILPVSKNYSEGIKWLRKPATSDRDDDERTKGCAVRVG